MLILLSLSQVDNSLFIFADVIAANDATAINGP